VQWTCKKYSVDGKHVVFILLGDTPASKLLRCQGKNQKERIWDSEHDESLKSRMESMFSTWQQVNILNSWATPPVGSLFSL